jgi:cytidylate kinase
MAKPTGSVGHFFRGVVCIEHANNDNTRPLSYLVTGPPGAGKSAVAQVLARTAEHSVLIEGDAFFDLVTSGAIEPWLTESNDQNTVVTRAAACAAGAFVSGGYTTVYDGVVGPWFLPTFGAATGLDQLDYVIILPPVEVCVRRVATRRGHGFTDQGATRKMHAEFDSPSVAERHVLTDPPEDVAAVAALIESARRAGAATHAIR